MIVAIDTLKAHKRNYNKHPEHQVKRLTVSLRKFGQRKPITTWRNTVLTGHGVFLAAQQLGWKEIDIAPCPDKWTQEQALAWLAADNELARLADPDLAQLAEIIEEARNHDAELLEAIGFDEAEFAALLESIAGDVDFLGVDKAAKPNPRKFALDAIYTTTFPASCCLAVNAGFKIGIQSTKEPCPCVLCGKYKLTFVDNDYFNYDHAKHLEYVKKYRPKYATVRDVMTPEQCKVASIEHYPLDQILAWAAELAEYAENVIIIPKYDCIDQIPDKYMLGYSVPTSHGGTPLPTERFKGRRVHLLGGSWKAQLAHMAALGDDVVSLDNNYQGNIAQMGGAVLPDGTRKDLPEYGIDTSVNPAYIALAISLGNMGWKINELYPVTVNQGENG